MLGTTDAAPLARRGKLPSLREFDRGVLALAGTIDCRTDQHEALRSSPAASASRPASSSKSACSSVTPGMGVSPSAWGSDEKHIVQRYTTEQSDFIIYCLHEQNRQWADVYYLFTQYFPQSPVRSLQGMQAIYYRSNKHVPACRQSGELIFDDESAPRPCFLDITSPRGKHRKYREYRKPFGLAQRYPDRAVFYPWVDQVTKARASWLASLRATQYARRAELRGRSNAGFSQWAGQSKPRH